MKERPILFSAPMVRALLDASKTQTRRPYKNRKHPDAGCDMAACELVREPQHVIDRICPYGQPGDRLWVRESWMQCGLTKIGWVQAAYYRADGRTYYDPNNMAKPSPWKPSIHMPRWASRILLEIVSVRVERLTDISEADARAEGVQPYGECYCVPYRRLWESINGAGSWDANPWVWCVSFRMVQA